MMRKKQAAASQPSPQVNIQEGLQQGQQYRFGKDFILDNKGVYYCSVDKDTKKPKYTRISGPLFVKEDIRNLDKAKVHSSLAFKEHGKYREINVRKGQIAIPNELMKLSDSGIVIPFEFKHLIVTYLRIQGQEAPYREVYSKIGFHLNEAGEWEYRHAEVIPKPLVTRVYDEDTGAFSLPPKGSLQVWIEMIKTEVKGHPPLEFIVAVGFAAPLVGYLSQVIKMIETIFIHMNSSSTVGKSSSSMLAVSAFGDPNAKSGKSLVQDWNSTGNSIMEGFNGNKGLPIVLDELSMNKDKELTSMFYSIVAGKGKGRLTDQIEQRERGTWATTVISNGEMSAFLRANENAGLKVRIKEFSGVSWTRSAENADNIKKVIQDNYGHAGIKFVEHMFNKGLKNVEDLWRDWMNQMKQELPQTNYTTRVAKDYAVIMTAVTLANEAMGLGFSEQGIIDFIVEHEEKASLERKTGLRAYEKIKSLLIEHQSQFKQGSQNAPKNCWGKITYHNDYVEFAVLKHVLEQELMANGFENKNTVLREWKEDGILISEFDRNTKRIIVFSEEEQKLREKLLGKKISKLEDTTYVLKIPKEEIAGMLSKIRTAESFQNDPDIEEELGLDD